VFPKVVVDTTSPDGVKTDTEIQLTNVSTLATRLVHCFYVDGDTWEPINANILLTLGQPTGWRASEGSESVTRTWMAIPPSYHQWVGLGALWAN